MGPNTSGSREGTVESWPVRIVSPGRDTLRARGSGGGTLQFQPSLICHEQFKPIALSTTAVAASHAGAAAAGTTDMTLAATPVVFATPRNVVITVTHASAVVAMSGTITGKDQYGNTITEAWAVTATGTTKTFTGKKAFVSVSEVTEVVAADASANTIVAGSGTVIGLSFRAVAPTIIAELMDGAATTAGTIVKGAGTSDTADYLGTYAPNTAPNGTHVYDVWYLVDDPTDL